MRNVEISTITHYFTCFYVPKSGDHGEQGSQNLADFIVNVKEEIKAKALPKMD